MIGTNATIAAERIRSEEAMSKCEDAQHAQVKAQAALAEAQKENAVMEMDLDFTKRENARLREELKAYREGPGGGVIGWVCQTCGACVSPSVKKCCFDSKEKALEMVIETAKKMRDSFAALCGAVARNPECGKILDDVETAKRCDKGSPKKFQDALARYMELK